MVKHFMAVNKLLERYIFAVVLSSMAIGWVFADILAPWKASVALFFGFMTLTTAFGCSSRDFARVLKTPVPIVVCLLLLHAVHPLVAKGLGVVIHGASSPFTVAMVLGAAVPVGVTSVIWSGMAKGDVPLSLAIVTVDTLLAPFIVPLTVMLFVGQAIQFDVPAMMLGLAKMIVIPTIVGVVMNDLTKGKINTIVKPFASPISKLSLGMVIAINVAAAKGQFSSMGSTYPVILASLAVQCAFGYASSWYAARFIKADSAQAVTITFSAGMRNISAGIVIAMSYFPPIVAVPVVLSMLFQQPFATITSKLIAMSKRIPEVNVQNIASSGEQSRNVS